MPHAGTDPGILGRRLGVGRAASEQRAGWTDRSKAAQRRVPTNGWSGSPEESHLRAPTDPCVTVSRHRALLDLAVRTPGSTASGRSSAGTGGLCAEGDHHRGRCAELGPVRWRSTTYRTADPDPRPADGPRTRPHPAVRHPPARDHPGPVGRGLGNRTPPASPTASGTAREAPDPPGGPPSKD